MREGEIIANKQFVLFEVLFYIGGKKKVHVYFFVYLSCGELLVCE